MTKIKHLDMAEAMSSNDDVTISNSFFGLVEKATYTPTGSRIKAQTYEYSADNGERLSLLLDLNSQLLDDKLNRGIMVRATPVGNIRAEVCRSDDRQFLAVNILRFENFEYSPLMPVRFYHGNDAEVASRLFVG